MDDVVITVEGLRKSYGSFEAVRGLDLEVRRGEILAFLGPNGAGKTTTVEILEGYRERTEGDVTVLGADPSRARGDWNARIGVMLQSWHVEPDLTVEEQLQQFAGYYPQPRSVDETIDLIGLSEQRDVRAGRLSGGQQRRLDLGLALIGDPELLFMDEPTTGFDPAARRAAWAIIASLRELGKTVFLTTHYMDEAQELADRVAIIASGRILADGTPNELAGEHATRITFLLPEGVSASEVSQLVGTPIEVVEGRVDLLVERSLPAVNALSAWALERGIDLPQFEVRRRSLEDVYLELTADA
jgi:ABC-2 type transport system ATP-binding protein